MKHYRKPLLAQDSERLIVMDNDVRFTRSLWRAIGICVAAGAFIAICLVLMGLVAYYGREYNW